MLKDITLGQYFPGNTIVHRLDPRTKLIAVVLYIAALFTANNWSATALVLLTLVFCVALSRIRPKALFKGLKPLIVIVILTAVLHLFYSDGNVICSFWVLRITDNGIRRAKALLPILVPLFVSAFRRADELATAMECRCYNGGEGRTRMKVLRMGRNDYLALAFWAVILAGSIILTRYGI